MPVAVNCWVVPTRTAGETGETVIEVSVPVTGEVVGVGESVGVAVGEVSGVPVGVGESVGVVDGVVVGVVVSVGVVVVAGGVEVDVGVDVGAGATTVRVIAWLVDPEMAAVISVVPAALPVANPVDDIVATSVSELAQVTWEEMSAVEPSE